MHTSTATPANRDRSHHAVDDRRLVEAVRGGDDHGFELLFQRYRAPVGAYVASLVHDHGYSEDITQDVFLSALRSLRASDRPIVFKPWIYEIARNACIDRHRRARRGEEVAAGTDRQLDAPAARVVAARAEPEDVVESRVRFEGLCRALLELPVLDRKLIVMRELEGRTYREIVERSGLTTPAVESALFRARRRLFEHASAVMGERGLAAGAPAQPEMLAASRPRRDRPVRRDLPLPAAGTP